MNDYMTTRPRKWEDIKEIPKEDLTDALKLVLRGLPSVETTAFDEPQDGTEYNNRAYVALFPVNCAACVSTDGRGQVLKAFKFPISLLEPDLDDGALVHVEGWGVCTRVQAEKEARYREEENGQTAGRLRAAVELQSAFEAAAKGPAFEGDVDQNVKTSE